MIVIFFITATLLAVPATLWLLRFLKSWYGSRTPTQAHDVPYDLLEKFLPPLDAKEIRNDPSKAVVGLADVVIKQEIQINELHAILDEIDEGVLLTKNHTEIGFINHSLLKMLNTPDTNPPGRWSGLDIQGVIRTPQLIKMLKKTTDYPHERDERIRIAQNDREMDVTIKKIGGPDSARFLMIFRDVTALVRSEQAARDLIANVAHQLRTPLTSIKGYAETLIDQDSIDMETSRRFLTIILKNADRLTDFVRDVLILTQLDGTGELLKDARPVRLKDIILKAVETATPFSEEKGIRVMTKLLEEEVYIRAIPSSIEQAIANLLDNAIKYTAAHTTVTIALEKKNGEAILSVSDEGPGIPCEALDKVFERFYRLERDRAEGTGLGLSIVKQTAQIHKGRAWAESRLGRGATFYMAIPLSSPHPS